MSQPVSPASLMPSPPRVGVPVPSDNDYLAEADATAQRDTLTAALEAERNPTSDATSGGATSRVRRHSSVSFVVGRPVSRGGAGESSGLFGATPRDEPGE